MIQTARALPAIVACLLACGCDDAPPATQTPAAETSARPDRKVASLPANMVSAVSASKSSLLLSVHFSLGSQPTVGQPLPVEIAVVPHRPFASLRVHFDTLDGLKLSSGAELPLQLDVSAEKPLTHRLVIEPQSEGLYMVSAAVETTSEEGNIVRIYSIPVIVSAPGATAPPPSPSKG
jgi:hypothetical protein